MIHVYKAEDESNEQESVMNCRYLVEACRPKRDRRLPSHLKDFEVTAHVSFVSGKCEHNEIPLTYDETMTSPRADEWMEAMKSKL